MTEVMKKGANTDCDELKIGGYKLLTQFQKIIDVESKLNLRTTKTQTDVLQERDEVVGLLRQQVELLEQELVSAKTVMQFIYPWVCLHPNHLHFFSYLRCFSLNLLSVSMH